MKQFDFSAKNCGGGWTYFRRTGGCYKYFSEQVNWNLAHSRCRAQGADLASVTDWSTNQFLKTINSVPENPDHDERSWIGGRMGGARWSRGGWQWTDGTPWCYESWAVNEPNNHRDLQDHVVYGHLKQWDDDNENYKRGYICQK